MTRNICGACQDGLHRNCLLTFCQCPQCADRKRELDAKLSKRIPLAQVTCKGCGYTWTKNCSLGFESEKDFYENYRPECPKCESTIWKIEEIIEARGPLNTNERELFSLVGGIQ